MRGSSKNRRKISLVSWEIDCFPKKLGGLNIKGCRTWNIASVDKLLRQLIQKKTHYGSSGSMVYI